MAEKPKNVPQGVAQEVGFDLELARREIGDLVENIQVRLFGANEPQLILPDGYVREEFEGKLVQIARLPFHVIAPLDTKGTSWGLPKGDRITKVLRHDCEQPENGRPIAILTANQVIPGNNILTDLDIGLARWKPSGPFRSPIHIVQSDTAVSLTSRHRVSKLKLGLEEHEEIDIFSYNLTSGRLVNAMLQWYSDQGIEHSTLASMNTFTRALELLADNNLGWQTYWDRARAREELGAIMVSHDHTGNALAVALETFISAPGPYMRDAKSAINDVTSAIRNDHVHDWSTFAEVVEKTFSNTDFPLTLTLGVAPVMAYLHQTTEFSIASQKSVEQAVSRAFNLDPDGQSKPYEAVLQSDPTRLLLVDPRMIKTMVEGVLYKWIPLLVKIAEASVDTVEAALIAELTAKEAQRDAWLAYAKTVKTSAPFIRLDATRRGMQMGRSVTQNLPEHVGDMMGLAIRTELQRTTAGSHTIPAVNGEESIQGSIRSIGIPTSKPKRESD